MTAFDNRLNFNAEDRLSLLLKLTSAIEVPSVGIGEQILVRKI
jgi:hypothetical protein